MPSKQSTGNKRFTRTNRLLYARDFQTVFNQSEFRVSHPNLLLLATTNKLNHPRIGLVVAKKNIRFAVARNRVKRVVRETFRLCNDELGNIDIIFLARKGIDKLTPAEQTALMQQSWRRLSKKVASSVEK